VKRVLALFLVVGLLAVAGCSGAAPNTVVGKWTATPIPASVGSPQTYEILEDGSWSAEEGSSKYAGQYKLDADTLTFTLAGRDAVLAGQVAWESSDRFSMRIADRNFTVEFVRLK
jgi:hypothetical protein